MNSAKKLPTWGRGVSKSRKIGDVVYGWPLIQEIVIELTEIFWKYLVKLKGFKNSNTNSNSLLDYCVQVENSRACKCFPFPLQISLSVIEIAVSDF